MEEAESSSLSSSTPLQLQALAEAYASAGFFFGGLVAAEGCFNITRKSPPYADGTVRPRFVFQLSMAERDAPLVEGLRRFMGAGSVRHDARRRPEHQPIVSHVINSLRQHRSFTVPFADAFLLPSAKRDQYLAWRAALVEHEQAHPSRWGHGPGECSVQDCTNPVRGRGLCRAHYYQATGY